MHTKRNSFFLRKRKAQTLLPMLIQTLDKGITDNVDDLNGRSAGKHAGADGRGEESDAACLFERGD